MVKNADESFGNAREIRKLVETMRSNQASRLVNEITSSTTSTDPRLYQFEVSDVP